MATTDILPFATGVGANVETQTDYAADSTTSLGFSAGTAASIKLNKVWRQSSFISAGLANFMVNRGISVPDDGNLANLVAEFEASLDAYLDKSIAGGVDVTLNPISEANYPIINLTGALTANINLIVPTAPGRWLIANNTTGAFTVTVKTAAGTGAVATQGTANQYYCDGTNVYSVIAGISQTQADARYAALAGSASQNFATLAVTQGGVATPRMVQSATVASTSGTLINFSSIPNWVKRITLNLLGVSTNGTTNIVVRIGSGGTPVATGYNAGVAALINATSVSALAATTGFALSYDNASTNVRNSVLVLTQVGGNSWVASGNANVTGTLILSAGAITLGGVLDTLQLTTTSGTEVFDAGSVNVIWEG
jgi:hypothetical protein